jgi:magnesium-transporting ATPase (P-type)
MEANQFFGLALTTFFGFSAVVFYFFKWGNASGTSFERGCAQAVKFVLSTASLGLGCLCTSDTFKNHDLSNFIWIIFLLLLTAMGLWSIYVYKNKEMAI